MRFAIAGVALLVAAPPAAFAQTYAPPRTADGHPDLGGVWTNTTDLPVERPDGASSDRQIVNGEQRTFLVTDPPDGKLPFRDRTSALAWRAKYTLYVTGRTEIPEFTLGPDTLPNRDRCLMAANSAAPPMASQGDNDVHQIVQTPGFVVLYAELMNETRIVPVVADAAAAGKTHRSSALPRWTGDSVGWWEGDAFVVETVNVDIRQGGQSPMPLSKDARVIERFTRISDGELLYQTEVIDPAIYTRSWKTESSFRPAKRIWEYACHEGNSAVAGILSGTRKTERDRAGGR